MIFFWVKRFLVTQKWCIGHHQTYSSNPWNYFTHFNTTEERGEAAGRWNNTAPTSTVFTIGNDGQVNNNSENYIAYVFAKKKVSVNLVHIQEMEMLTEHLFIQDLNQLLLIGKRVAGGTEDWFMFDNKRDPYNVNHALLYTNTNGTEYTSTAARNDFLSNGFKMRLNDAKENASGSTYIYFAFAEEPLVSSNNVPATAR